jgi:DNA-directed RNA polymerase subunit RPC12/RpoP
MIAFSDTQWVLILAMVAFYLVLCIRTAWAMRRSGRSFWLWLVISFFTTSVLATMVLFRDQRRGYCPASLVDRDEEEPDCSGSARAGDETITCGKCGHKMRPGELRRISGKPKCPHCGRKIDLKRRS